MRPEGADTQFHLGQPVEFNPPRGIYAPPGTVP